MSKPYSFQQIQAFKAVMETGTTTTAAIALNTTQPSISRKLADFQRATGLKLFEHHHGRLRPTREGRQLYESVRRNFEGLEKIETAVGILRKSGAGVLRLGSTSTLATGLLPQVIKRFLAQFPGTFVGLQTLPTPQLADLLNQNLIDLAVTTGDVDPSIFETRVMTTTSAVCIVPQNHPLARADWVDLEELRRHQMILLNDSDNIVIRMRELLARLGAPENIVVETNSSITICALVVAGVGVGIVNPYIANTMSQGLVIKELRPSIRVDVSLARSMALAPSLLGEAFSRLLADSTA
ncbi:LysR substrate-binding domain-containing protein [Microvirga sp. TS319]|uniref:LysR substrate-binding domain-containing protein n=1 Tax=Microvirga sp. TS319 TaxID=3241165 RepID=UPI003519DC8D